MCICAFSKMLSVITTGVCVWKWGMGGNEGRLFEKKGWDKGWEGQIVEKCKKKVRAWIPPRIYITGLSDHLAEYSNEVCVCLFSQLNWAMERDKTVNSLTVACACVCWQKPWLYWQLSLSSTEALDKSPGPSSCERLFMWHHKLPLNPPKPWFCVCVFVCNWQMGLR